MNSGRARRLAIEIGGFGTFQVGEEAPDPRREMLLEQLAIGACGSGQAAADHPRHDLAEDRRVILRLGLPLGALDPSPLRSARSRASGRSCRKPVR